MADISHEPWTWSLYATTVDQHIKVLSQSLSVLSSTEASDSESVVGCFPPLLLARHSRSPLFKIAQMNKTHKCQNTFQRNLHVCITNNLGFPAKEGQLVVVNLSRSVETGTFMPSRDNMTSLSPWLMRMTTHISLSLCSGILANDSTASIIPSLHRSRYTWHWNYVH